MAERKIYLDGTVVKFQDDNQLAKDLDSLVKGENITTKLDDLGTPDDTTDLDFGTVRHGLVPKGTNVGDFLKDDGTWASAGGTSYADKLNLAIAMGATPDEQVDVDADCLTLFNTSFEAKAVTSVNLTISNTASGANGLDTGSVAADTWYYIWVIAKADGTTAGLLSVSTTIATITLPTGYLYGRLIGALYTDGTSDFVPGTWGNGMFFYDDAQSVYTSTANDKPTTFTDLNCSSAVPIISKLINFYFYTDGAAITMNFTMRRNGSAYNPSGVWGQAPRSALCSVNCDGSQVIEWKVTASNAQVVTIYVNGYKNIE